jgi:hypothetical protein
MRGIWLPVVGSVLQVVVTKSRPAVLPQLVQHIARRLTLKQTTAGTFLIGGGWPGGFDQRTHCATTHLDSIVGSAWVAARPLPTLAGLPLVRAWAGVGATRQTGCRS